MSGIQLPIGIDTVNPVDADYKKGPWTSLANAKAGIPLALRYNNLSVYIVGDPVIYHWLDTDLSDAGLVAMSSGSGGNKFPIARYVYLVNDASDATLMGGSSTNAYTTWQAAYNAANTLQVALGGANKVSINVGVTTAAVVGNLTLIANYNANVIINGLGPTSSILGTVIGTTFTFNATLNNLTVGTVSASGGITLTSCTNCIVGNMSTSPSGAGDSGAISITSCLFTSFGTFTTTASSGNVGAITFTSSQACTVSTVNMISSSTIASFNIGLLSIANSRNIFFNLTVNINTSFGAGTGTVGGINVATNCQNIVFNGAVNINATNSAATSNVVITQITINNAIFNSSLQINNVGSGITRRGGSITTVSINNCRAAGSVRIIYFATTAITSGVTFSVRNFIGVGITINGGFIVDNYNVTFDFFELDTCQFNDTTNGLSVGSNQTTTTTVPFIKSGVSMMINNTSSNTFSISLYNPAAANTADDLQITRCTARLFIFNILEGDINATISGFQVTKDTQIINQGNVAVTKSTVISNSNFSSDLSGSTFSVVGTAVSKLLLKNTTFQINFPSGTLTIVAYNSYLESVALAGNVTTYLGTISTSTLRARTTEVTGGLAQNNSYIETF